MEQIWQLLTQYGVSLSDLELIKHSYSIIVMIPVITTILAILRYILGVKSPSIFAVLILTFAFVELGFQGNLQKDFFLGLKYGSLLYFIVSLTATLCYLIIRKARMHYIPKMSIVFTTVAVGYFLLIIFSRIGGIALFLLTNTFVLIAIATLAENIATTFARRDLRYSLDLSLRTYIVSFVCYFIISIEIIKTAFLNYPYLLIILIFLNIYIGKFKGLRLTEYFRFKNILFSENNTDEQTKSDTTK